MTKRIWISMGFAGCLFFSLSTMADPSLDYRPRWRVGLKWDVAVQRVSTMPDVPLRAYEPKEKFISTNKYHFLVEDVISIDDEPYWCVLIRYVKANGQYGEGDYYRAYFRETDYWLKRLVRFCGEDPKPKYTWTFPYGPVLGTDLSLPLPLEFPLFTEDGTDFVHERGKPKSVGKSQAAQACRRVGLQKDDSHRFLKIVLEENVFLYRRTTQLWEKGNPWWSEALYERHGQLQSITRLVSVDGKELPDTALRVWSASIIDNKLGVETNQSLVGMTEASTNAFSSTTGSPE